ncbi:hypothetical protein [Kitasatospora sp. NPDC094011]|uniref:hypothetical protein n=1 Tax=Kitasatospora sp. NPDC094011 TaxID=3364090 RepID=UPI0038001289
MPDAPQVESPLHLDHSTEPAIFLVSTASKTKNGTLTLTFSKPEGAADVSCRSITVKFPVGPAATDLTTNPSPITTSYGGYGTWRITPQIGERSAGFVCTPQGMPGNKVLFTAGRHFTLVLAGIPVARTPGIAALTITASIETAVDTESWDDTPVTSPDIAKSREDLAVPFFFRAFSSVKPRVPNSGATELRWEGSETGVRYFLAWDDRDPVEVFGQSHQTPALTDTTTFVLDARTTENGRSVSHFLSTTVTVKDPDIAARNVLASHWIGVTDTFTATHKNDDEILVKRIQAGTTVFAGEVTMNAKLTVNADIAANGNVEVASTKTLTANGHLQANASITLASAKTLKVDKIDVSTTDGTVNLISNVEVSSSKTLYARKLMGLGTYPTMDIEGHLYLSSSGRTTYINGPLVTKGNVTFERKSIQTPPTDNVFTLQSLANVFGAVQSFGLTWNRKRTFTAPSSGIAIALVQCTGGDRNPIVKLLAGGKEVRATARRFNSPTRDGHSTTMLALGKGQSCQVHFTDSGGDSNASYKAAWLFWIPFGVGEINPVEGPL